MDTAEQALNLAVNVCGGPGPTARRLTEAGVKTSRFQVYRWQQAGKIPAEAVLTMEEISKMPREFLRPDIYPRK